MLIVYKHMNADHVRNVFIGSLQLRPTLLSVVEFSFLEAIDLQFVPEDDKKPVEMRKELYETLLQEYSALPTKLKDLDFADYAVVNVAPSVVPNPYLPGFRVFAYNISAGANGEMKTKKRKHGHRRGDHGDKESYCRREIYRDTWKCHLNESWHSDAESPSRSNKQWSPLGYAQVGPTKLRKKKKCVDVGLYTVLYTGAFEGEPNTQTKIQVGVFDITGASSTPAPISR